MKNRTPKDLLSFILYVVVLTTALLLATNFLGETHGLVVTAIVLIGQAGLLHSRVSVLERQLRAVQGTPIEEKAPA